ncbi:MAG: tetratricopeptide repeat protein [Planctomycetota bacterium]
MAKRRKSQDARSARAPAKDPAAGEVRIRTPRKSKATRWRAAVLIGIHLAIAIRAGIWLASGREGTLSPLEPSEAMEFAKHSVVNAGLIFFLLLILSTLVLGRWFCGWACHLVALQDLSRALLIKIGLRPRPLRSRWMGLLPIVAAGYMFLWPLAYRLWIGDSLAVREVEMVREGYWDTFPTWVPAIFTFVLCGFVAVYFLGAKGFCTYACPYGAVFGVADKLSPGRIRVTDACVQCGHCSLVCTSNVDVSREVHDYGMVVDRGCMKCMDCVSVCPEDALYYGMGAPALFAKKRTEPRKPRPRLPLVEEVAGALAFGFGYFAIRGYYQERGFLLSVGIAACFAYLVVVAVRLVRRSDVRMPGLVLKKAGHLRAVGGAFGAATLGLAACAVPYGIVPEVNTWRANRAWDALADARARWFEPDRAALSAEEVAASERLLGSAEIVRDRSGVRSLQNTMRLAWGKLFTGDPDAFEQLLSEAMNYGGAGPGLQTLAADQLRSRGDLERAEAAYRAVFEATPQHVPAEVRLAEVYGQTERFAEARAVIDGGLAASPGAVPLLSQRAVFRLIDGDVDGAVADLREALATDPDFAEARDRLWQILMQAGRPDEAIEVLRDGLRREGAPVALRAHLAQLLLVGGDTDGAADEARRLAEAAGDDPQLLTVAREVLSRAGAADEAAALDERLRALGSR